MHTNGKCHRVFYSVYATFHNEENSIIFRIQLCQLVNWLTFLLVNTSQRAWRKSMACKLSSFLDKLTWRPKKRLRNSPLNGQKQRARKPEKCLVQIILCCLWVYAKGVWTFLLANKKWSSPISFHSPKKIQNVKFTFWISFPKWKDWDMMLLKCRKPQPRSLIVSIVLPPNWNRFNRICFSNIKKGNS